MIAWDTEVGRRALHRLQTEDVIWLTTVAATGAPQPRPVWFVWEAGTLLIYSQPAAHKLRHLAQNPHVALHFNTDAGGEDVQVLLGRAHIDLSAPLVRLNAAYCAKYQAGIAALGMDVDQYSAMFSTAVRIVPVRLRGLEPLPAA